MLPADIPTLLLSILAVSVTLGVAVGVAARDTGSAALRAWAAAMAVHGACYSLFLQRGDWSDWLTVVLANTLLASSFGLMLLAVARFKSVGLPGFMFWGPPLLVALLFPTLLDHPQARVILGSVVFMVQHLLLLALLLGSADRDRGTGQRLLVGGIVAILAVFLLRGIGAAMGAAPFQNLATPTPQQTLSLLAGIVALLLASLGFVFMVKERTEHQANEARHLLTTIFDSSVEAILLLDRGGIVLAINRVGAQRYGTTPQALIGARLADVVPADLAGSALAAIRRVTDSGNRETLIDQRDGHTYRLTFFPVHGEKSHVVVYGADITRRLAADEALRRSEAHFRAFFERSMVGMATTSPAKGWLEINQALCDILGYPREELLQKTWTEITHPGDLERDVAQFNRVVAGEIEEYTLDKRFIRRDGSVVPTFVAARCVRLPNGGVDYFVALVQDISDRTRHELELTENLARQRELNKKLEEAQGQLLQSEKMASIGQLAAGVAHELNNPIGFVSSNLGTLKSYLDDLFVIIDAYETAAMESATDCPALDAVRTLKIDKDFEFLRQDSVQLLAESADGLQRVRKIVQDLKDFSRPGESNWQWAGLHQGLDSTLNIVWNELKYKCTLHKDYGALPLVRCLPSQLNQVFMNLLVNAAHAIPEKGDVTIRTGQEGDEVFVAVADTGTGIAPENLNRIFDPFFTTKPVGKGTGLGLSLAYGIVQKHHGRIEVDSQVGRGTTFTVWLPIDPGTDDAIDPAADAVLPAPTPMA